MPTLAHWLIENAETGVYRLYKETRCAREEQSVPLPMQLLRTWPRARTFVKQLPRNPQLCGEYEQLCSAEQFTALSDRYVYRHPPQLYHNSEALLTLWGALVEEYCLPWSRATRQEPGEKALPDQQERHEEQTTQFSSTRLNDPAEKNVSLQAMLSSLPRSGSDEDSAAAQGVILGRLPTQLHLRGWLASLSIRAMAYFELLVCERRMMPFGYQPGTPYGANVGYLTVGEVEQLALSLRNAQPPNQAEALADYQNFRRAQNKKEAPRMIDEVLPAQADIFLKVVHIAAQQRLGLICSIG